MAKRIEELFAVKFDTPRSFINKNTCYSTKATRKWLLTKTHNCAYCGGVVVYNEDHCDSLPDNFATLDHYYSKGSGRYEDEENFVVICCYGCNQKKHKIEEKLAGPSETKMHL